MTCRVVVLPQPLGPRRVRNSPSLRPRSRPARRRAWRRTASRTRLELEDRLGHAAGASAPPSDFLVPAVPDLVADRRTSPCSRSCAGSCRTLATWASLSSSFLRSGGRFFIASRLVGGYPCWRAKAICFSASKVVFDELLGQLDAVLRPAGQDRRVPDEAQAALLRDDELDRRAGRRRLLDAGAEVAGRSRPPRRHEELVGVLDVVDRAGLVLLVEVLQLRDAGIDVVRRPAVDRVDRVEDLLAHPLPGRKGDLAGERRVPHVGPLRDGPLDALGVDRQPVRRVDLADEVRIAERRVDLLRLPGIRSSESTPAPPPGRRAGSRCSGSGGSGPTAGASAAR